MKRIKSASIGKKRKQKLVKCLRSAEHIPEKNRTVKASPQKMPTEGNFHECWWINQQGELWNSKWGRPEHHPNRTEKKKNRGRSGDGVWESPGTVDDVALIQTACPDVEVSGRLGQCPRPEFQYLEPGLKNWTLFIRNKLPKGRNYRKNGPKFNKNIRL